MDYTSQLDAFVVRLRAAGTDYKEAQIILSELLDMIEAFNGASEYAYFLKNLIPIFLENLERVPIKFVSTCPEHKLRNLILEIIHRLIMTETFEPYSQGILLCLIKILPNENEDNGVLCMKIITSLHKAYKGSLADQVDPFLATIDTVYDNLKQTVKDVFSNKLDGETGSAADTGSGDSSCDGNAEMSEGGVDDSEKLSSFVEEKERSKAMNHSMKSFKVLAECPITMVSLYTSYKPLLQTSLPSFLPKIIDTLVLEVDQQKAFREEQLNTKTAVTAILPLITNRQAYLEFILGQVKAASFLAYVFIRGYYTLNLTNNESAVIPNVILRLLQDCPAELSVARKELLHATRHILSTPFRSHFVPKIELLFNEKILIGEGLTSYETLRPLAYSTVADFIHNVRTELTPTQIWSTVQIYCDLLKDESLALTVQIMSAKLLLNLVDRIMKLSSKLEGRHLFMMIIDSYAKRFMSLNRKYDYILKKHHQYDKNSKVKETQSVLAIERYTPSIDESPKLNPSIVTPEVKEDTEMDLDVDLSPEDIFSLEDMSPIAVSQASANQDSLKDARYLFRTLMSFLKAVIFGLKNCNPPVPSQPISEESDASGQEVNYDKWNDLAKLTCLEEINILKTFFRGGISCLRFFSISKPKTPMQQMTFDFSAGGPNFPITSSKEEKDLMEIFATIFIHIDPASFNEIVTDELPFMFECMLQNAALLHLPQFFLASEVTSANFLGILILFLRANLDQLDKVDFVKSNILIRLFKLCFMSVNLFPATNESVILPHINHLILESLRLATKADEPILYAYIVRTLFRSIGGGRFESLYKEILPILPVVLASLNKLIANSQRSYERDFYVELCLLVPVRLSALVPHLKYLTTPLVYALNGSQELVSQGLRIFELCVDNLTADYFDPMIASVADQIMEALWRHLEPVPYHHQHSHTAIRILGKLGGRNHKHLKPYNKLQPESALDQEVQALFSVHGLNGRVPLSITPGVESAIKLIEDPRIKPHYRTSAFNYLISILKLFIDTTPIPKDFALFIKSQVELLKKEEFTEFPSLEPTELKDAAKLDRQQKLFSKLLEVLFYSLSIPEVADDANSLIDNITIHFVFIHLRTSVINKIKKDRPFSVKDQEGKVFISEYVFFNSLNYALSSWDKKVRDKGVETIKKLFDATVIMFGSAKDALNSPLFRTMFYKFTHCCYSEYYHCKLGGVLGLETMFNFLEIPSLWFFKRQFELIRCLFFILRDTPETAPYEVCDLAKKLALNVLKLCNKDVSKETILEKPFQTLVGALSYDLASAVPIVREVSREALQVLSETTGVSVAVIMGPLKHLLLTPIFGKPLRALPFPMQIGNIDAITYCLGLEDTFLTFNDELNRLLFEALASVDAEDESLANVHRLYEYRTSKQLIELRVVCIQLLTLALTKPGFSLGTLSEARIRILGVFFKALCNKSTEIINAAHQGLKTSLDESAKLPKELLQNGLRPMLMNLSDHKKLTISGLEALARLLELLISYFRVEIGRKLLDHLMAWAQINTLRLIAGQDLENNHTVQIVMAILNIFHLLPARAYTYMEEIINTLQYLEGHLDRHQNSPFRKPILKFLNRFAENCLEYYLSNFRNRKLGSMLAFFAGATDGPRIREVAITKMDTILADVESETSDEVKITKFANTVDLISAILQHEEAWFKEQAPILKRLTAVVDSIVSIKSRLPLISPAHLQAEQATNKLQCVMVEFMRANKEEKNVLYLLVNTLASLEIKIHTAVEDYIFAEIVTCSELDVKLSHLSHCVDFIARDDSKLKAKTFFLNRVFDAILLREIAVSGNPDAFFVENADESKTSHWLEKFASNFWQSANDIITDRTSGKIDAYRYALLEATSILLRWAPKKIEGFRKDIIKFSWNYIKLEDSITKQVAYVTTAYFIAAFETPPQLATQVFVALLRTHQNDCRHLVRQALDIMAPVMSLRLLDGELPNSWLKWPRRVLLEDGFNVTQVLNVYQFIKQNPDLFFIAREHFISNIITAMGKLTILANAALENQVLAIDLAELILSWENKANSMKKQRIEEDDMETDNDEKTLTSSASNGADSSVTAIDISGGDFSTDENYSVPFGQREACITFLIRYVCISPQRASESELGQKALGVLFDLLSPKHWQDVTVKVTFFEKFLLSNDLNSANLLGYCLNALEVLGVVLEWKTSEWIVANLDYLHKLLEKCIKSTNHDIQEVLQRILRLILKSINKHESASADGDDESDSSDAKNFVTLLTTTVSDNLSDTASLAAGVTLAWTLANYRPATLDSLLVLIMKTFNKLCKDHISITNQPSLASALSSSGGDEAKMTTKLLEKILNLCAMRISNLGDQRRIFLSLLAQLIDKSLDKDTLEKIIKIVKGWVFSRTDLFPTTKETAAILAKMMVFEIRGEPTLLKEFYQIIVDIFEDEAFSCTELTVRMEHPFLVGTRSSEVSIRRKLMSILNASLEKDISKRLYYVIREQNWEYLADYPWLNQALQLLFGLFDMTERIELCEGENKLPPLKEARDEDNGDMNDNSMEIDSENAALDSLIEGHQQFLMEASQLSAGAILEPLIDLFYQSTETVLRLWKCVFPLAFLAIPRSEHLDFTRCMVVLLSKDYHTRQTDMRPNVIQMLLEGVSQCNELQLPPVAVECLASNFNAWSQGMHILENIEQQSINGNSEVREVTQDALCKLYASLKEDDMFYGLWRRRAKYTETISALSHEQTGLWQKAQQLYENAQIKARSGAMPYGQSEYCLWEDHWILCAEKLQQWEILTELAKHEGFSDLLLECGWRVADWNTDRDTLELTVKSVMDVPTPRRQVFETFLCLQGYGQKKETLQDLSKLCDEGIQLALKKWHGLLPKFGDVHIPLLHVFQQYVEFMEASQVYASLVSTDAQNLDVKSQELKRVLQVWRERLPNTWDDVNIWNDLVTWRQHAFQVINQAYVPLIPVVQSGADGNASSHAYRGFHEIAWVINRFAHVCRKHNMPEVCVNQLTKIYQLPNIEIQEAFLKLKEQVKCHYLNPNELNTALDVIRNTNLVYFAAQQKAEFFTLKGVFLSKLNQKEEANKAFATSVQIDLNLPKAWAEWGVFNDKRYKENPNDLVYANNAISCYLQAAGLYKNGKTRKLLARILWLISLDDASGTLAQAFENFKGEVPVWYWITFIPQLLTSLSYKEAKLSRQILIRIAKSFPQALHFQLRTTKEDFAAKERQFMEMNRKNDKESDDKTSEEKKKDIKEEDSSTGDKSTGIGASGSNSGPGSGSGSNLSNSAGAANGVAGARRSWEYVEEIMGILKTAYPLLTLSLESLVDQINQRFKCTADEDAYRLGVALLNDGVQYLNRIGNPREDAKLPHVTEVNITRFAETVLPKQIRAEFEQDLVNSKPNLESYITKLRKWRDRLEEKLDNRLTEVNLENLCPHLSEFHHQKFEDIEVPGQYLANKDNNDHFVKIERFLPTIELTRGTNACYKRIKIRGHNGSLHSFTVQFPAARQCRREECLFQLFRIFDDTLSKKVELRRRNIHFTLPIAIPLSPHIRIVNDDSRDISLQRVYEDFCFKNGKDRDEPFIYTIEKLRAAYDPRLPKPDIMSIRVEILSAIQTLLVPTTVLKNYFLDLYPNFEDFWLFRKQFTAQYASFIFTTYTMCVNTRQPQKIYVNRGSGSVWTSDMLPCRVASKNASLDGPSGGRPTPLFYNAEMVPFRLTPNIQKLIGESGLEGILSIYVLVIARALTEPKSDLDQYLTIFVRDEVISWCTQQEPPRPVPQDSQLRDIVTLNVELITKRVLALAHSTVGSAVSSQSVLDLIAQAVNPHNLAAADTLWMAYF